VNNPLSCFLLSRPPRASGTNTQVQIAAKFRLSPCHRSVTLLHSPSPCLSL
jgi:hypothetical protein